MNKTIRRLNQIQQSIHQIDEGIRKNDFNAAGITLSLCAGDQDKNPLCMQFGLSADVAGLIHKIRECLIESQTFYRRQLKTELVEIRTYFENE